MAKLGQGILEGKKTYVAAVMGILGAVAAYLTGELAIADAAQLVLTAVLGMTIRKGIATDTQ